MSQQKNMLFGEVPQTRDSIAEDLRRLGLLPGATVIVHSSLRSLGFVCGGPVALVQALMDVVTEEGTIVMPTFTGDVSDPATWENPPVPQVWWQIIRETMPAFDPRITPTWGMGKTVEVFRTWPGVLRSAHPAFSFAAWGKEAEAITRSHSLDYGLGESSPLARIYERDGQVLLLGVGFDNNTSFHLAEYRVKGAKTTIAGAPVWKEGGRKWVTYQEIQHETERFLELGEAFERETGCVIRGRVGLAEAKLFSQRAAVDFAKEWLERQRQEEKY